MAIHSLDANLEEMPRGERVVWLAKMLNDIRIELEQAIREQRDRDPVTDRAEAHIERFAASRSLKAVLKFLHSMERETNSPHGAFGRCGRSRNGLSTTQAEHGGMMKMPLTGPSDQELYKLRQRTKYYRAMAVEAEQAAARSENAQARTQFLRVAVGWRFMAQITERKL